MIQGDISSRRGSTNIASFLEWLAPHASSRQPRLTPPRRQSNSRRAVSPDRQQPSRRHTPPTALRTGREPWGVRVKLKPLDDRYAEFKVAAKNGASVSSLERRIRDYYQREDQPVAGTAPFQLYDSRGNELALDAKVSAADTDIWYRASISPRGREGWKLSHWGDRLDGPLEERLAAKMVAAIEAGSTVAELKETVAQHMCIHDANRVVLVARDGMRRGSLQGSAWEVRKAKAWLCRWLSIDVNPEKGYVVLRGLKREFIYHPRSADIARPMPLKSVVKYLDSRVLHGAHRHAKSELGPRFRFDGVRLGGETVSPAASVEWGETYDFGLLDEDAAEGFSLEESWLLRPTEACSVCVEDKTLGEMPVRITARCKHEPATCKDCVKRWLQSSVEAGTWAKLKCPDCSELLEWQDVKRLASKETFGRYDSLVLRAALKEEPNFHFCLAPRCESGQVQDMRCPRFRCVACKAVSCLNHHVPWHAGETCEDYDRRNRRRRKDERASEIEIKRSTKTCPNCKKPVHKFSGCNHMICVCGFEWCYNCLAPFQPDARGIPMCMHLPPCAERDPFMFNPAPPPPLRFPRLPAQRHQVPAAGAGVVHQLNRGGEEPLLPFEPQHLRATHAGFHPPPPPPPPPLFWEPGEQRVGRREEREQQEQQEGQGGESDQATAILSQRRHATVWDFLLSPPHDHADVLGVGDGGLGNDGFGQLVRPP